MEAEQKKINNRLKSLRDISGVTVKRRGNTITVQYKTYHSLDFKFYWLGNNHYAGYFLGGEDKSERSQAVIALKSGMEAIYFCTAYALLIKLHAKQKRRNQV